jgi:hypothetical protein
MTALSRRCNRRSSGNSGPASKSVQLCGFQFVVLLDRGFHTFFGYRFGEQFTNGLSGSAIA